MKAEHPPCNEGKTFPLCSTRLLSTRWEEEICAAFGANLSQLCARARGCPGTHTHFVRTLLIQAVPSTPCPGEGVDARVYVFPPCHSYIPAAEGTEVSAPLPAIQIHFTVFLMHGMKW